MFGAYGPYPVTPITLPHRLQTAVSRAFAVGLLTILGLAAGPAAAGAAINPASDAFYQAPQDLAALAPGTVIRSRQVKVQALPGVALPFKTHQVLYRTADTQSKPVAVAATIFLPLSRPAKNRKLLSYQIAYDGLATKCQPSFALQTGNSNPVASAELLNIASALAKGWTVVTTDYEGPDNTWIAGKMAGQAVLDGVRAAEGYAPAGLGGVATPVGLMGYSGGGHATQWASELASTYAPELNFRGVVAGGVPANPILLKGSLDGGPLAGVLFAAITGLKKAYPNVDFDQYLNDRGRATMRKLSTQCIGEFILANPFQKVSSLSTVPDILAVPEIRRIAIENTLGQHKPVAPTFLYHARHDELVGYPGAALLAQQYCAMGAQVQFNTSNSDEHATLAVSGYAKAFGYMSRRFGGDPNIPTNCGPLPAS